MKCLLCGKELKKGRKKFCCNKHKDRYHNLNNPRGKFSHLADADDERDEDNIGGFHDSGYVGHGQA